MSTNHSSGDLSDAAVLGPLRRQMLQFAQLQLRDVHLAEDAVQEALLSALRYQDRFNGQAALKTWVFAILKNKIIDILRQRTRLAEVSTTPLDEDAEQDLGELFDARGHWDADGRPKAWGSPDGALQDQQFWTIFETCLELLPPQQARVFMMREFIGLESPEICEEAGVTISNLNVLLYRARMRLRQCLEMKWFDGDAPAGA
ncbi:RNA polymerase factor sigma-70 [Amphibiibacter pelophylacis]|uniref:RNA polymerase factor sigma-70 n=1 Tax=Amphibiibacter pelophylacis TaxID=1799477 RepID=A0ACC6NYM1_9BURK